MKRISLMFSVGMVLILACGSLLAGGLEPLDGMFAKRELGGLPAAVKDVKDGKFVAIAGRPPFPQFLAYVSGGKVVVRKTAGTVAVENMTEPWLLAFGGEIAPVLIVAPSAVTAVEVGGGGWTLAFAKPEGKAVVLPLFGGIPYSAALEKLGVPAKVVEDAKVGKKQVIEWEEGVPAPVVALARDWAKRLRRVPTGVSSKHEPVENGVRVTETFTYLDIDDEWKTPKADWVFLPSLVAMARTMGGPVKVAGDAKELLFHTPFGPLAVLDGTNAITYTIQIPQLGRYLFEKSARPAPNLDNAKFQRLRAALAVEIDKMLKVNEPLAPVYFYNLGRAFHYFGNPADTITVLCQALPYVEPAKTDAVKAHVRMLYEKFPPLDVSWLDGGARREFYQTGVKAAPAAGKKGFNLQNVYAAWEYVQAVGGEEEGRKLWPAVQANVTKSIGGAWWDVGAAPAYGGNSGGYGFNARLNGLIGFVRFARLAGDKEAEQLGTALLARGLAAEYAFAWYHQYLIQQVQGGGLPAEVPPKTFCDDEKVRSTHLGGFDEKGLHFGRGIYGSNAVLAFLRDLSPEAGAFLHDYARAPVTSAVNFVTYRYPGHWMSKSPYVHNVSEELIVQPWQPWASFLGRALVMRPAPDELYWYVGDPVCKAGDLYFIQKVCLALDAFGRQ